MLSYRYIGACGWPVVSAHLEAVSKWFVFAPLSGQSLCGSCFSTFAMRPHSLRIALRLKTTDDDSRICVEIYYRQISAFWACAVIDGSGLLYRWIGYPGSLSAHDWIQNPFFATIPLPGQNGPRRIVSSGHLYIVRSLFLPS